MLSPIARDLAANRWNELSGIVNGTTNFMLTAMADEGCMGEKFAEFIGTPYDASVLGVYYLYPTKRLWFFDDRRVTCVVYEPTSPGAAQGKQLTGTLRNAQR